MGKTYTNSGKSVKERLLNLSRAENYNPQMMISRYIQERLLYAGTAALCRNGCFIAFPSAITVSVSF